ncbi:MAG: serine/threonine-protein kinase [Planctomycetia bacterium]|jgi:serine/threonine protein kinase
MDSARTSRPVAEDLSGRRLGGYRLLRPLGSGAMADVYLAEQTSLGRHVAVKVLRPETLRHPAAVERFDREARSAAALVHGHIVQIHEVACVEGVHFLAEEYVAGPSLRHWLEERGPLDARQALTVLRHVGSALMRAAEQGIVHRDIKPDNLLVSSTGDVKVADFGLARSVGEDVELTQDGMTLGTPLYMSPEQGQGSAVDIRSDLYSLGATVYHLLAGRPPFSAATALGVVMAHVHEPLQPLGRQRPDLPAGVCGLVERLLAKRPEDRFATPAALLTAVDALVACLPDVLLATAAPLAWTGERGVVPEPDGAREMSSRFGAVQVATQHLRAAVARNDERRMLRRRTWWTTAVVAAGAALFGFVLGRSRAGGPAGFRRRNRPR